jgi:hypothetical protein
MVGLQCNILASQAATTNLLLPLFCKNQTIIVGVPDIIEGRYWRFSQILQMVRQLRMD